MERSELVRPFDLGDYIDLVTKILSIAGKGKNTGGRQIFMFQCLVCIFAPSVTLLCHVLNRRKKVVDRTACLRYNK